MTKHLSTPLFSVICCVSGGKYLLLLRWKDLSSPSSFIVGIAGSYKQIYQQRQKRQPGPTARPNSFNGGVDGIDYTRGIPFFFLKSNVVFTVSMHLYSLSIDLAYALASLLESSYRLKPRLPWVYFIVNFAKAFLWMTQSVILENPAHFAPTSQALMIGFGRIEKLIFFLRWSSLNCEF